MKGVGNWVKSGWKGDKRKRKGDTVEKGTKGKERVGRQEGGKGSERGWSLEGGQ
jgi:hypothetical protein